MKSNNFFENGFGAIAKGAITRSSPVYVQYYVTARCNLRCQQCNIIYANSDQSELDTKGAKKVIDKLADAGVSILLLTGGEPFIRADLPELVAHCIENGIHPRLQTNGLATRKQLEKVAEVGANDISISLDTLQPALQDSLNGSFSSSFFAALQTISLVNEIFPAESFAALGCVLSPRNMFHVPSVVKFATEIGWWVSLVPAHSTDPHQPRAFSTFEKNLNFSIEELKDLQEILLNLKKIKREGLNLYDSNQYLDDIFRYVSGEPVTWRDKNYGLCDAVTSYFAVTPNGDMSVCCDFRMPNQVSLLDPDFSSQYKLGNLRKSALPVVSRCTGCMYGSFPEITNSLRFAHAASKRLSLFFAGNRTQLKKINYPDLTELAKDLAKNNGS